MMPVLGAPRAKRRAPRLAYIKSLAPLFCAFIAFTLALTSYAFLSQIRSPAAVHHLGWQAWEAIEIDSDSNATTTTTASLRLDVWDPLAKHTTGLTELAVKACLVSPKLFPTECRPDTTPEEDEAKGSWVLVSPDLNVKGGFMYLNLWYRRTRRRDAQLITDIKVLADPAPDGEDIEGWVLASGDLHAGRWSHPPPLRLWYKAAPQDPARIDSADTLTEVSVHYGGGDPFFGFQKVQGGKVVNKDYVAELVYRRGNPEAPKAGRLTFGKDGTFKIMQIADLHYSVGEGKCRDTTGECAGDSATATWLAEALDAEKPDLVVFSGDQLNGQKTSYDARSVFAKFAAPVIDRKIPWAAVFGNHDSEINADRDEQMRALSHMPYSLARAGPADIDGVGNYDLRVYSSDPSRTHLFTLYFLDSHSYKKTLSPLSWIKPEYDYIKPSQTDWYLRVSSLVKPIQRPFQPDGAADLGNLWSRSRSRRRSTRDDPSLTLAKPSAIMFFHIPLAEAYEDGDRAHRSNAVEVDTYPHGILELGGQNEGAGNAKHSSNIFSQGIQKAFELEHGESEVAEVKVLSHGHCHLTDRCRRVSGVWMCFDGGSSFSGYGSKDFERRVRIYIVSDWGETITSYKRLVSGNLVDKQVLVGKGAPAGWGRR